MEPKNAPDYSGNNEVVKTKVAVRAICDPLCRITPVSKILAAVLFIVLPFLGVWVGYQFALEQGEEMIAVGSSVADSAISENDISEESKYKEISVTVNEDGYIKDTPRESFNDYTVEERSKYYPLGVGELVEGFYIRKADGIFVFTNPEERLLEGADADTFEVNTLWPVYARDKNHVYYNGDVIQDADPATFVPICGSLLSSSQMCAFSKDTKHAFTNTKMIQGVNVESFVYLFGGNNHPAFAIDDSAIYMESSIYGENVVQDVKVINTLTNGQKLSLATTSSLKTQESSWSDFRDGYAVGDDFKYVELVAFSDATSAYSLYIKENIKTSLRQTLLSKVMQLGAKPVEIP